MFRRKKVICVFTSILLLLSLASVAVSWPGPLLLARTKVAPTERSPINGLEGIEAKVVTFDDFSVTTDADTTATMYLGGLLPWRLSNESGGALTFTFYAARSENGNELMPYDSDGVAVATMTLGDDCEGEMPPGLGGVLWIVIKANSAGTGVSLVCRR